MTTAVSRRRALAASVFAAASARPLILSAMQNDSARPNLQIRGIYGGFPKQILDHGQTPADYGVNAIWVGSGSLDAKEIERYHKLDCKVFAEFNSMHHAQYLKEHPDAAPIGADGKPAPPPNGWQGVSPFHAGYRQDRMNEFRRALQTFEIDGIWLDYHHAQASWEQAEPNLPDTDFSPAALKQFQQQTGIALPAEMSAAAGLLLTTHRDAWTDFRCGAFTDWVREYRQIVNETRPAALLGTFHCPWSPEDFAGAIRHKLGIDLAAQAPLLDVFSIMPYHARFGHANDPAWISRQTRQLAQLLGITGKPDEQRRIWPIVQLADWGERVPVEQIASVLEHGSQAPSTGVMVFHWSGISKEWEKAEAMKRVYRSWT
jgi:hypothetical protein